MSANADGPETGADADPAPVSSVDLDHRPALTSAVVSVGAGTVAMLTSAPFAGVAIPLGLAGLLFLAAGLFSVGSRRWVSLGVVSLFAGVLVASVFGGATPLMILLSAVGLLVAWDTGQQAVTVGEQFGRTAPTRRGELVHAAGSTLTGLVAAGATYGVYLLGTGGQPVLVVVLLALGAVALVWALRD